MRLPQGRKKTDRERERKAEAFAPFSIHTAGMCQKAAERYGHCREALPCRGGSERDEKRKKSKERQRDPEDREVEKKKKKEEQELEEIFPSQDLSIGSRREGV